MLRSCGAFALAYLAARAVCAQDYTPAPSGFLEVRTVIEKLAHVVDESGRLTTELVPLEKALPGDEVVYTVAFKNIGDQRADHVLVTNPIPADMRYVAGSATGPGTDIWYSADGGKTYAKPEDIRVADASGGERPASADDYTHIRWALNDPLDAGAKGFARFRAVMR